VIAVVVRTVETDRAAEALRAAVGLTLRGERVCIVRACALPTDDRRIAKCLSTLVALGHEIDAPMTRIREACAVEVWT
jgi:hypothetical protein